MKILITTDLFTTETNGVVTSVKNLYNELKHKGHDVRILTLSDTVHSHKEDGVYYIRSMPLGIYPEVRMPLSYRHRLIRELIEWEPDVIHSQCEFFSFQYAKRISRLTGAPIVHTYHTLYEQYVTYIMPSRRIGKHVVRIFSKKRLKRVDKVIAPTRKVENALRGYKLKNDVCIIPSGISLEQHKMRITEEERRAKRNAIGISDDKTVLINLGRLGTEKNLSEIVKMFAKAHSINDKLMLLIVGDGPARSQLEKEAESLEISDSVIFTGMVSPEEVHEYYQLGDVFVSASTSETQGLTYIEAAANGLPLICRKDPCLEEVLKHGKNGFEYTSEEEFLSAIATALSDPQWTVMAGRISEEISSSFDKANFCDSVEAVYRSVPRK